MCGIVGFITTDAEHGALLRRAFLEQALIVDTVRGKDATGIFMVNHEESEPVRVLKSNCTGFVFTNSMEYQQATNDISGYRAVIGHNRLGTRGGKTINEAHPFQIGGITQVHNGTIMIHSLTDGVTAKGSPSGTVDSEHLCSNISKYGAKDILHNVDGAYALVWHDASDNTLNVARNDERPLHMCTLPGHNTIFIASEAEMLGYIFDRLTDYDVTKSMYEVPIHNKFTFKAGSINPSREYIGAVERRPAYTPPQNTYYSSRWQNGSSAYFDEYDNSFTYSNRTRELNRVAAMEANRRGKYLDENRQPVDVPTPLVMELNKLGFSVHKQYPFTEIQTIDGYAAHNYPQSYKNVVGFIGEKGSKDFPAIILGALRVDVEDEDREEQFTVQPIAVYNTDDKQHPTIILCRMVSCIVTTEARNWLNQQKRTNTVDTKSVDKQNRRKAIKKALARANERNNTIPLQCKMSGGAYATVEEFIEATEDGCALCEEPILPKDHRDIMWIVEEGIDDAAVCETCANGLVMAEMAYIEVNDNQLIDWATTATKRGKQQ